MISRITIQIPNIRRINILIKLVFHLNHFLIFYRQNAARGKAEEGNGVLAVIEKTNSQKTLFMLKMASYKWQVSVNYIFILRKVKEMANENNYENEFNEEECTHDCSSCSANCGSAGSEFNPADFLAPKNEMSDIKHVIGIISGKGGVGKSFVCSSLAVELSKKGYKVGILDADITGPSIQKMFGIDGNVTSTEFGIIPRETDYGIKIMSINFLLEDPTQPVIWRGPMIADLVKQFWTDVVWGDLDYLFVDMPPGTGDVPLTVFQSLPIDGVIIVTSPQSLVNMIVTKAYNMAKSMDIPILGIVENYSYFESPEGGAKINIFGESKIDDVARQLDLKVLGKIPIMTRMAELSDKGQFEFSENLHISKAVDAIENID